MTYEEGRTKEVMERVEKQSEAFNEFNKCEVYEFLGFEAETNLKEVA